MCVRIGKPPSVDIASLRENYISPELLEDQVLSHPVDQVYFLCFQLDLLYDFLGISICSLAAETTHALQGQTIINLKYLDQVYLSFNFE